MVSQHAKRVQRLRAVTDNSTDMFRRLQVVRYGYAEYFSAHSHAMLGSGCGSGILKSDFFAFGDIQLKVIRCSPCCNIVHLLLSRAGVD